MRTLIPTLLLAFGASAASLAQAQSCGSGGGATVCLTATGTTSNVQLGWTVSGAVKALEIYRDTDPDPVGRTRIAIPAASATSYPDATAADGTPYWYWVKFTTNAGSYNSGVATAKRNSGCPPTAITPYIGVNGSWTQTSAATVTAGNSAILGPQPVTGGSWGWSGCGTSGSARQQTITPAASCTATATYTNTCGAKTTQAFAITVPGPQLTAVTTAQLGRGWNIGNTLESLNDYGKPHTTSQETVFGNPAVNQQLLNAVAAAGFKSVRIPVEWAQYSDSSGNIAPTWLARVKQVIDMARNAGLYVFINQHKSDWYTPIAANQAAGNAAYKNLWTQVANYFKDYDNHLLFAGTNEIHFDYGVPSAENCTVQKGFNQVFVDAVRATGGNNASRTLIFQGYNTDINNTIGACGAPVPTDTISGRLMMEFHYYDSYNLTLNDQSTIWQWGSIATDPSATESWDNEAHVDAQFDKAKSAYADKGIPVIIGEYCAMSKTEFDPSLKYRDYWTKYVTASAIRHGFAPYYWDTGSYPNHSCGLFNRTTGADFNSSTIKAIFAAP